MLPVQSLIMPPLWTCQIQISSSSPELYPKPKIPSQYHFYIIIMTVWVMKTPEHWRALPRRALLVSILAQNSPKEVTTSRCDITWHHDVAAWRHVTSGVMTKWHIHSIPPLKLKKSRFSTGWPWPMTLTIELSRDSMPVPKFKIVGQTFQPWECSLTDRHTDGRTDGQTGPILYPPPLTREGTMSQINETSLVKFHLLLKS